MILLTATGINSSIILSTIIIDKFSSAAYHNHENFEHNRLSPIAKASTATIGTGTKEYRAKRHSDTFVDVCLNLGQDGRPRRSAARQEEKSLVSEGEFPLPICTTSRGVYRGALILNY